MSELQEAKRKLKEMIDQRNHLAFEIRKQENLIDELEHGRDANIQRKLGLSDHAFHAMKILVERGVINWKGQYRHPARINVSPIWRTIGKPNTGEAGEHSSRTDLAEEFKPFSRNTGIEMMHKRWRDGEGFTPTGQPTLSHSHQLNSEDKDYQKFLELHGEPTHLEMVYIKSGRHPEGPEEEQAALDAMNHAH